MDGLRRVSARHLRFMSVVNNGFRRRHWHRGMNCVSPPNIRRRPTYTDGGSADIAGAVTEEQKPAMRDTIFGGDTQSMSLIFVGQ